MITIWPDRVSVEHRDVQRPSQSFTPRWDLAAGFDAAANDIEERIVDPRLAQHLDWVSGTLVPIDRPRMREVLIDVARPYWVGRRHNMSVGEFVVEVQKHPLTPPGVLIALQQSDVFGPHLVSA